VPHHQSTPYRCCVLARSHIPVTVFVDTSLNSHEKLRPSDLGLVPLEQCWFSHCKSRSLYYLLFCW
jgi:hypothetical protein